MGVYLSSQLQRVRAVFDKGYRIDLTVAGDTIEVSGRKWH